MKLHEEFKLFENMWEPSVTVFVGNERNEENLLDKVAKTNPSHTTIVYDIKDILRAFDRGELTKVYTDAEGMAEIKKVCDNMPARIKNKMLNVANLVEACELKEAEFSTQVESDFKRGFLAALAEISPENKADYEILHKFDFRSGAQVSFDMPTLTITLPQSVIDEKNYEQCFRDLIRETKRLTSGMNKIIKLSNVLEDALISYKI